MLKYQSENILFTQNQTTVALPARVLCFGVDVGRRRRWVVVVFGVGVVVMRGVVFAAVVVFGGFVVGQCSLLHS
jgi:hypothetical protein